MKNQKSKIKNKKASLAFTLVELLVVVSIMAIVVGVAVVSYTSVNRRSRDAKRRADIEQLRSALEMYRADIKGYPGIGGGNWTDAANLSTDLVPGYIPTIPADPKSTQTYRYMGTNESGGKYYGYCLSALLESENPADTCSPDAVNSHNFGIRQP